MWGNRLVSVSFQLSFLISMQGEAESWREPVTGAQRGPGSLCWDRKSARCVGVCRSHMNGDILTGHLFNFLLYIYEDLNCHRFTYQCLHEHLSELQPPLFPLLHTSHPQPVNLSQTLPIAVFLYICRIQCHITFLLWPCIILFIRNLVIYFFFTFFQRFSFNSTSTKAWRWIYSSSWVIWWDYLFSSWGLANNDRATYPQPGQQLTKT